MADGPPLPPRTRLRAEPRRHRDTLLPPAVTNPQALTAGLEQRDAAPDLRWRVLTAGHLSFLAQAVLSLTAQLLQAELPSWMAEFPAWQMHSTFKSPLRRETSGYR